ACFLSSRFAAVASVAGGMIASHANACKPVHPVPAMVIHGTEDTDVPYGGGGDSATFLAVDTVVKLWVGINNCPSNPITSAIPNTNISDNCTAYHYVYANGTGKSSVELYQVKDGGHTWPGSAYELPHNNTNMDFSASKEIWRFFRQYCLSALYTIDKIEKEALDFNLYPNPTNGLLNFSLNKPSDDLLQIEVFDILGNLVLHQKTANNFIAVDELTTGIYFLHLKQNNKNLATVKFIKE
ncbi:MAG TPA: T9SS type A sorting domain-containing protein, partial [Bacteroidia bacterium]|nr:T9SS type A sorting domain-containing protein [Bacteroidia bacterium]